MASRDSKKRSLQQSDIPPTDDEPAIKRQRTSDDTNTTLVMLDELINGFHAPVLSDENCRKFEEFDEDISRFVNAKCLSIANERQCHLLFVAERSSHVWGTSHAHSDNDVKAIIYYSQRRYYSPTQTMDQSWKVVFGPRSNQSELECSASEHAERVQDPDVELNMLELIKVSQMICRNDPNIFELFMSPMQYFAQTQPIIERFREIILESYEWLKLAGHYAHWARGNYKQLTKKKKKKKSLKPLKTLFVVWRGILSAEWLVNHKTCRGLPLYQPTLIAQSPMLSSHEKETMLAVLTQKLQKGSFAVDGADERRLFAKADEALIFVNQRVSEVKPQTQTQRKDNKTEQMEKLEKLVFEVIESAKT